jgi:eukaryotic-like serine/threonine-protein kinase
VLDLGTTFQGYRVESVLGHGAMGEVYKVRHLDRGTVHAMKYLALPSRKVRQRIQREAQAQTRVSHPNVVGLLEVIEIDGDPALIMEYVEGPTLEQWLASHKPTQQEAEATFRQLLAGVAHAHRKGLVHRDLKPANVLMSRTKTGLVPKVADFGIAKIMDSSGPVGSQGQLTRTGTSLGSPAYMAPEQIRDAREVDATADVWSLGCLLYELLLHRRAFEGSDVLDVMNAAQNGRFVPPREVRSDLPERFVRAIEGCLKVDKDDRFESVDEIATALDDGGGATVAAGEFRSATPQQPTSARPKGPNHAPPSKDAPAPSTVPPVVVAFGAVALALVLAIAAAFALL